MTEATKDIAALERPVRDRYDWSLAVWRECDQCGKQHTGTVTAEDGSQICAHCADQIYWSAWQVLAERALDQLEAERQRVDKANKMAIQAAGERDRAADYAADYASKLGEELVALKGDQVPVGEIVAWAGTDIEKGITRQVDFRFLHFNVQPGQQLFTVAPKPVVTDSMALAFHHAHTDGAAGADDIEEIKVGLRAAMRV